MTTTGLVPDQLWIAIQPLLPPEPPKPKGGRPRVPDRAVAGTIIFMLRAGLPWRLLPARELGAGSLWRITASGFDGRSPAGPSADTNDGASSGCHGPGRSAITGRSNG